MSPESKSLSLFSISFGCVLPIKYTEYGTKAMEPKKG